MSQGGNLAYVIDRVETRFGRLDRRVKARLATDLNLWINRTCRRFSFWFLVQEPEGELTQNFPMDDLEAALTVQAADCWVGHGWLITTENRATYPFFYRPWGEVWLPAEVGQLLYVKQFDKSGGLKSDLRLANSNEFLSNSQLGATGLPVMTTLLHQTGPRPYGTDNNSPPSISTHLLQFSPIPNDVYLFAVSFRLASLPLLDKAASSNLFLWLYPEAIVTAGLMLACDYEHEPQEKLAYRVELYGAQWDTDKKLGGMLGDIVAEGRKRHRPQTTEARWYKSQGASIGRGGTVRRRPFGSGYYIS